MGTQACSFDRLVVDSPSTSTIKTVAFDTQSLMNQTILQQLTVIGERLDKIEQKTVKKHQGLINPKGGHGGRVVTLSPPTSEAGVRFPARPQVGKLVVAVQFTVQNPNELYWFPLPFQLPVLI